jgi:hypothetical protein
MAKAVRPAVIGRIALLSAVLAGLTLALLLAGSPELHALAHPDAGEAGHSCLVTTMQGNGCEAAPIGLQVTIAGTFFVTLSFYEAQEVEALFSRCRVFEHAPPYIS